MPSVMAFLQARMGSTRLPGKVLLRIAGKSILERTMRRLRAASTVDEVAVLTTLREEDDDIVAEAERLGAHVFRGAETDVLKRFNDAARRFRPELVLRATADNPLIEIGSVDRIVRAVRASGLEYCMESELPHGAATEVITARALERVHEVATAPRHREHVTLYVKERPDEFRMALLAPPDSLRRPGIRVTVDTPEDFFVLEELINSIPESDQPPPLERYLDLAESIQRERV